MRLVGELPDATPLDESKLHFHFSAYNIPNAGREWFWLVPPIQQFINKFTILPIEDGSLVSGCEDLPEKRLEAVRFLKEIFETGGSFIPGNIVKNKAIERGISNATLYDAQKRLNISIKQNAEENNLVGKPNLWFPPEEWPI